MNSALETAAPLLDAFGRPLGSLRISVTDHCNLRCQYCMPEENYTWLPRTEILRFEEIATLARIFIDLGVDRLRLTGGEPLLRRDLPQLIRLLKEAGREGRAPGSNGHFMGSRLRDLSLTTNGLLLATYAGALREAGLDRVTVSLDTLRPERFGQLARRHALPQVLDGIRAARAAGFDRVKVNTVVIKGFNEDELCDLIDFGRKTGVEVRFIEYMDVGGATHWSMEQVVSRKEMLDRLSLQFGPIEAVAVNGGSAAPADRYRLADGTVFGIISSTTQPFCSHCDRARITPDGLLLLCLYANQGVDLKSALRSGADGERLRDLIRSAWQARRDRGAEERKAVRSRGPLFPVEALRHNPHLEMHTRGG
jgi:cyclic pyranopterin phosphate synthase